MNSKFGTIRPHTMELAALDRLKKFLLTCNGENLVSTLKPLFFCIGPSFLQVRRTTIKSRTSSNFGQIRPRTAELAALERLKKFQ